MLAIDPGTSIAITGILFLYKGGILQMVSQHCVACRIVILGLNKTLRKIGVVFVPKLIYKQSCKLFPQPFGFLTLHLFYFNLMDKTYPMAKDFTMSKGLHQL